MKENVEDILEKYDLKTGSHKELSEGACVMELVSYLANEPWSDHPQCACPILTEYAIRINDKFNDEHRQLLKPIIPLLLNSKVNDETQVARKRLIRWRNVTVTYPLILECYKLPEFAEKLRSFKNTLEDMAAAAKFLAANKEKIYKAANAYTYANANANTYANTYTYTYTYANANAYTYANANANANTYADAYANANANADAYANADANAYAYADADAFREKVAHAVVETLRLAAEIKLIEPKTEDKDA